MKVGDEVLVHMKISTILETDKGKYYWVTPISYKGEPVFNYAKIMDSDISENLSDLCDKRK